MPSSSIPACEGDSCEMPTKAGHKDDETEEDNFGLGAANEDLIRKLMADEDTRYGLIDLIQTIMEDLEEEGKPEATVKVGDKLEEVETSGLRFIKGKTDLKIGGEPKEGRKQVTVVEFWATWCPPCRDTIPHLSELQTKYKGKNVFFVGVTNENEEDQEKEVVKFVTKTMKGKMEYTVAIDTDGTFDKKIFEATGGDGIPHAVILDVDNTVVFVGHPEDEEFEEALEKVAAKASARAPEDVGVEGKIVDNKEKTKKKKVKA